jgi:hypothetical protein
LRPVVRVCLLGILAGVIWWNWDLMASRVKSHWETYQVYRAQQAWLESAPPPGQLIDADGPVGLEPPSYLDAPRGHRGGTRSGRPRCMPD